MHKLLQYTKAALLELLFFIHTKINIKTVCVEGKGRVYVPMVNGENDKRGRNRVVKGMKKGEGSIPANPVSGWAAECDWGTNSTFTSVAVLLTPSDKG